MNKNQKGMKARCIHMLTYGTTKQRVRWDIGIQYGMRIRTGNRFWIQFHDHEQINHNHDRTVMDHNTIIVAEMRQITTVAWVLCRKRIRDRFSIGVRGKGGLWNQ